jgi:cysteine desulfurase
VNALETTGNASSLHATGRRSRKLIEESREQIAAVLGAKSSEVVFTSGGTEANNLALKGVFWASVEANPARARIITSAIEHHAVLDPLAWLIEYARAEVDYLDVDSLGRVSAAQLRNALAIAPEKTALVSVMWANNEVGTVQPITDLAAVAHEFGVFMHSDAVQALGQLPLDFQASGLDLMTISGHKAGGPHGVGALIVSDRVGITALTHGGGQERGLRSGTPDAPAIAAMAAAVAHWQTHQRAHAKHLRELRDYLVQRVLAEIPAARLNGIDSRDPNYQIDARLPANAHFSFTGCEGDALLMLLDAAGVECSTGSACSAGMPEPSHVLLRMGLPDEVARGSLRFSLGWNSTKADVDKLLLALPEAVARASKAQSQAQAQPKAQAQAQARAHT